MDFKPPYNDLNEIKGIGFYTIDENTKNAPDSPGYAMYNEGFQRFKKFTVKEQIAIIRKRYGYQWVLEFYKRTRNNASENYSEWIEMKMELL